MVTPWGLKTGGGWPATSALPQAQLQPEVLPFPLDPKAISRNCSPGRCLAEGRKWGSGRGKVRLAGKPLGTLQSWKGAEGGWSQAPAWAGFQEHSQASCLPIPEWPPFNRPWTVTLLHSCEPQFPHL